MGAVALAGSTIRRGCAMKQERWAKLTMKFDRRLSAKRGTRYSESWRQHFYILPCKPNAPQYPSERRFWNKALGGAR